LGSRPFFRGPDTGPRPRQGASAEDTKNPGKHNDQATYVFQPLVFDGIKIFMPTYHETWKLDVGAGTWSP